MSAFWLSVQITSSEPIPESAKKQLAQKVQALLDKELGVGQFSSAAAKSSNEQRAVPLKSVFVEVME